MSYGTIEEKLYYGNINNYLNRFIEDRNDFASRVLFQKNLELLPPAIMGSVLGYTYLGEIYQVRRDDIIGDKAYEVDLHEAIHTPDEYETRVLVAWILSKEKPKYLI